MPLTSLYTCSRCRREFNFNNIRYDEDRSLICVGCLGKKQKLVKKEIKPEKPEEQKPVKFICVNCRFKFSIKSGSPKELKCPYCGRAKLMIVKRYKDEDDLIKDSMDARFDY